MTCIFKQMHQHLSCEMSITRVPGTLQPSPLIPHKGAAQCSGTQHGHAPNPMLEPSACSRKATGTQHKLVGCPAHVPDQMVEPGVFSKDGPHQLYGSRPASSIYDQEQAMILYQVRVHFAGPSTHFGQHGDLQAGPACPLSAGLDLQAGST